MSPLPYKYLPCFSIPHVFSASDIIPVRICPHPPYVASPRVEKCSDHPFNVNVVVFSERETLDIRRIIKS